MSQRNEPIPVLYEDGDLVVCRKCAGVLSEAPGMPELLAAQLGGRFFCVHRLDREVAGVMVLARDGKTAAKLSEAIASRAVTKQYLAVVEGIPAAPEGVLEDLLFHDRTKNKTYVVKRPRAGVKSAALDYTLLATAETESGPRSLLRITLHTGRTHQIRVQFGSRRMPLVGDGKYGSSVRSGGIALLSHRLVFPHPATGETMEFSVPLPDTAPWTDFSGCGI